MELEEWALEHAAQVVSDVERHGVTMTWSQAHRKLLDGARFLDLPAYIDQGDGEYVPVEPGDDATASICPGFAEEVACSVVHHESRAFFPVDPAKSHTGIAVPWDIASELVARLNFVLCVRARTAQSVTDVEALKELAGLASSLSGYIADELGWVGDDDIVDDDKIEGRRYLLMPASKAYRAAQFLYDAGDVLPADTISMAPLGQRLVDHLTDAEARDTFMWDLEWWITDRTWRR